MKTLPAIALALGSFVVGIGSAYLLLRVDYEELRLNKTLTFVDNYSKNSISLPSGTVLVKGSHIPWAPDDYHTAFLPIFVKDDHISNNHPHNITQTTYYSLPDPPPTQVSK